MGTGTGVGVGAGTEQGVPLRAMITSNATGAAGAGGVNTAAFSRDTGGGGLAGRGSTLVEGVAGGGVTNPSALTALHNARAMSAARPLRRRSLPLGGTARSAKGAR